MTADAIMPRAVIMTISWPYAFVYNYAQRGMRGRGGGVHASRVPRRPVDLVVMDGLGGRAQDCARVRLLAGSGTPQRSAGGKRRGGNEVCAACCFQGRRTLRASALRAFVNFYIASLWEASRAVRCT